MKDDFRAIAKEKMSTFKVTPPTAVWDRVADTLEEKKHRGRTVFVRQVLGICAVLLLPIILFFVPFNAEISSDQGANRKLSLVHNDSVENVTKDEIVSEKEMIKLADITTSEGAFARSIGEDLVALNKKKVINSTSQKVPHALQKMTSIANISYNQPIVVDMPELAVGSWQRSRWDEMVIAENLESLAVEKKSKKKNQSFISTQYAALAMVSANVGQADATSYDLDGGLNYVLKGKKKMSFETGIHVTKMSRSADGVRLFLAAPGGPLYLGDAPTSLQGNYSNQWGTVNVGNAMVSDDFNFNDPDLNEISANVYQSVHYLEVPLILRYSIVDARLGLDVLGGIHTNFLVKNIANVSSSSNKTVTRTDGLKAITNSGVVGLSVHYDLGKKLQVHIDPRAKYYNQLTNDINSGLKPLVFGVYTGLSYRF